MLTVLNAHHKSSYLLDVRLSDGSSGIVDMESLLWGPVFEPLRNVELFRGFKVSVELGTVVWSNGADVAPEWLREHMQSEGKSKVAEEREKYG